MDITTLDALRSQSDIEELPDGIRVIAQRRWVAYGEQRISYTTLVRLVECCREYHWRKDIPTCGCDSICRSMACDFRRLINVDDHVTITYRVVRVGGKSYSLRFEIRDGGNVICATADMVCVFFDPASGTALFPDRNVRSSLVLLQGVNSDSREAQSMPGGV
jgi:acyl-CoA thioesterase FadM